MFGPGEDTYFWIGVCIALVLGLWSIGYTLNALINYANRIAKALEDKQGDE